MTEHRDKSQKPHQHLPRSSLGVEWRPRPDIAATASATNLPTTSSLPRRDQDAEPADRTVTGTVVEVKRECIWIEIEDTQAKLYASELMLDIGEVPADRYTPGDHFEAFVFQMEPDPESGAPQFSVRRAAPYLDTLNRLKVGVVIRKATVVNTYDLGIEMDVDGVRGNALFWEIPLAHGEAPRDRYQPGDIINDLLVDEIDHRTRGLYVSVKRNTPSYAEMLNALSVGDVVTATITAFGGQGLWLNVGGLIGWMGPQEVSRADSESTRDRYSVGDTVSDLFVWKIDHATRSLSLSARRNTPDYVEALEPLSAGEVVSATVTGFQGNGGLWLNVGGVIGGVAPRDLGLTDSEVTQDRYTVGDTVTDLYVWQVNRDRRDLSVSVYRNAPGYVKALADVSVGDILDGIVAEANEWGVWLHISGVLGWMPASEILLDAGEASLEERYALGDSTKVVVWQIDSASRAAILSVRRLDPDFPEQPIVQGAVIDAMVRGTTPRGIRAPIRVLAASANVLILPHALSLSTVIPRQFQDGEVIQVRIVDLDEAGHPTVLSHRRALDGWDAEVRRLTRGVLVPQARLLSSAVLPSNEPRVGVDLGPITGFIPEEELDQGTAKDIMTHSANLIFPVVIESVDHEHGTANVSNDKFDARWRELAGELSEGDEAQGELRGIENGIASLDLGLGLLAELPVDHLPSSETLVRVPDGRIGEAFSVRIVTIVPEAYKINVEIKNYDLAQMIMADETLTCELKEGFVASPPKPKKESGKQRENRQQTNLRVVRAMAGMMNRDGGHVIVGITDPDKKNGEVVGWRAGGFENPNALSTALSTLVARVLTPAAGGLFELRFETLPSGGPEILDIVCHPASEPIFLRDGEHGEFPVRYPAMTKNLVADEHETHIQKRFSRSRDSS